MDGRTRAARGAAAEVAAERYLQRAGMRPVARDVRLPGGQIDLVMLDGDVLVVVEVKARRGTGFGLPEEAVDASKLARLRRLAAAYRRLNPGLGRALRVDVVAIELNADGGPGRCRHIADVLT
ncbi:MAG: YraN family protein [Candidatus Dormibacteraeota bacterium]|nr:YraN family protein [Candidatus Dormibacteraeota bacterium]